MIPSCFHYTLMFAVVSIKPTHILGYFFNLLLIMVEILGVSEENNVIILTPTYKIHFHFLNQPTNFKGFVSLGEMVWGLTLLHIYKL